MSSTRHGLHTPRDSYSESAPEPRSVQQVVQNSSPTGVALLDRVSRASPEQMTFMVPQDRYGHVLSLSRSPGHNTDSREPSREELLDQLSRMRIQQERDAAASDRTIKEMELNHKFELRNMELEYDAQIKQLRSENDLLRLVNSHSLTGGIPPVISRHRYGPTRASGDADIQQGDIGVTPRSTSHEYAETDLRGRATGRQGTIDSQTYLAIMAHRASNAPYQDSEEFP